MKRTVRAVRTMEGAEDHEHRSRSWSLARVFMAAVVAVACTAISSASPAQAFNPCNGDTPPARCQPHPTPRPPTGSPVPAPPAAYTEICNPFCNLYWTRSATKVISGYLSSHANTIQAYQGAIGGVLCAALGVVGFWPGAGCVVVWGLHMIDVGYSIDEFGIAAAANECVRVPEYVPWDDPIPYNGTYCST